MEIKINSVHFTADQKLVDFVNKKVGKLDTFFDGIINAEVTMKVLKPETAKNKVSELKISIPANGYLFAIVQGSIAAIKGFGIIPTSEVQIIFVLQKLSEC